MKKLTDIARAACRITVMCALAGVPVFTGCNIGELEGRIDKIETRLTELEADMAAQIESLKGLVDGKTTVVSCTLNDEKGIYTIVLSDGQTLEVAKTTETDLKVGVKEIDGVYYWTLDGELLEDGGKNIPVSGAAPSVRVNVETDEWEISADGGKTWLSTGIVAREGASIFAKVDEDEDNVYFILSDGTKLTVAKTVDSKVSVLAGKQYVSAGRTVSIKLELSNISKTAVTKPDGWRASVEGYELKITAPAADNPYAETKGKVAVIAIGSDGKSSISEVHVEVGEAPVSVSIGSDQVVKWTLRADLIDNWDFLGYYYGAMKLEDYNPEKLVAELKANTRLNPEYNGMSLPLADLLGHEPEAGVTYIAWALPKAEEYYVEIFDPAEIVYASAASIKIDLAVSNITFEGADLLVTPKGTSTYYAGVVAEGDYDPAIMVDDFNSRDAWILDGYAKVNGEYDGPLAEYGGETVLIPGLTYIAYAAPVGDIEVYTEDDIYSVRVVIPALVAGGSATVSVGDVTATTNSVSATVSAGEETYRYYTDYLPKEEFDRMTDDQVVTRLVERGVSKSGGEEYTVEKTGLKPNVEGYIVAVAVDKDGKRSELVKKDANTSDLEFSSIAVEAVASTVGLVSAEISVSSTADIVKFHYINKKVTEWTASFLFKGDDAITEKELAIKTNYQVMAADAVDGKVSLPFDNLTAGEKYVFCVVGVDKDGVPTRMKKIEYTPGIDKFVRKDDALWTANYADRPVLSNFSIVEGEFGQTISADITVGSKCARYWVFANDPSYISGTGAKAKTVSVITAYGTKELTGSRTGEVLYEYFHSEYMKVYVVWQDTDGNYYEYDEVAFQ